MEILGFLTNFGPLLGIAISLASLGLGLYNFWVTKTNTKQTRKLDQLKTLRSKIDPQLEKMRDKIVELRNFQWKIQTLSADKLKLEQWSSETTIIFMRLQEALYPLNDSKIAPGGDWLTEPNKHWDDVTSIINQLNLSSDVNEMKNQCVLAADKLRLMSTSIEIKLEQASSSTGKF